MLRSVLLKSLRDQRRALLWWGTGLVALAVFTLLFYPSFRDMGSEMQKLAERMPEELLLLFAGESKDMTSPEGFLNSQLFVLMVPLLFMVFAIGMGSGAIAGEEERGTLELLLSNPVPRWRVAWEKFAATVLAVAILAFVFWVGLEVTSVGVGMEAGAGRMAEATLSAVLLALAFGALALAVGCATGSRGLSIGVSSAVGVAAYFLNALAPVVEVLQPYRKVSPFYYYMGADPLANGLNLVHASVLIGLVVVLLAAALITFERRDLAT
ncbi:MAG: ABC transporter permease subunit [Chloroflexi bacterium]|nr:ABC transporter permease subunit [Chloroflexota bacterium]